MKWKVLVLAALASSCSSNEESRCENCEGTGPQFGGLDWAAPDQDGNIRLHWRPASDAQSMPDRITYRIYAATVAGRALAYPPVLTTLAGVTDATVQVTPKDVVHHFVVRAVAERGAEDTNRVEKSATATPDQTAPMFAGVRQATPAPNASIALTWDPAADVLSPAEALRYEIFYAPGDSLDLTKAPQLVTERGATTATLEQVGRPGASVRVLVRARDVAGNVSGGPASTATAGPDAKPPTFAGCVEATYLGDGRARITWNAATDDFTEAANIGYDVFVATSSGAQAFAAAPKATVTGQTSVVVGDLAAGNAYHFVCRAKDSTGNRDGNVVEKVIQRGQDVTPPTFAGLTAAALDAGERRVTLSWQPATDDTTTASDLVYDVYESATAGGQRFDEFPKRTSDPGATSITIENLRSRSPLYWVVRARDKAQNRDRNTVEVSGTTGTSFSLDVRPILDHNCAVVGCHVTGIATGGLSLSPSVAYDNIVNVRAGQRPSFFRVLPSDPDASYLYMKITLAPPAIGGSTMPAPQTGNALTPDEKSIVRAWIQEGARRN